MIYFPVKMTKIQRIICNIEIWFLFKGLAKQGDQMSAEILDKYGFFNFVFR